MAKKRRSRLLDVATYALVRSVLGVFSITPEWLLYPALDCLGRLYLRCAPRRRAIAVRNLKQALGPTKTAKELDRLAIRSCGYNFMVLGDLARVARMLRNGKHRERVDDARTADEIRARLSALGQERPPILNVPHLGSWEIAGIQFCRHYSNAHIIARPLSNPLLQRWVHDTRSQLGVHVHPRRGGVRKLVAALRDGCPVGLLPDQNQRTRGIFVEVFGRLASCDRSPARLAQISGVALVCIACYRIGRRYRFRMELADVFEVDPGPDGVLDGTARLQRAVENLIMRHPEQYFWVHDRYRTRPKDEVRAADSEAGDVTREVLSTEGRAP